MFNCRGEGGMCGYETRQELYCMKDEYEMLPVSEDYHVHLEKNTDKFLFLLDIDMKSVTP